MATTTNYGWTTPDDTALVKDGALAIRTLGSSVDTTTKNLNPSTTLGDIEYRSSTANTNTRLAIGSTGQVLTVSGGVPAWATPSSGGMTLISTTSLSGTSVALTSIPTTYKELKLYIINASISGAVTYAEVRLNNDSGASQYAFAYTGQYDGNADVSESPATSQFSNMIWAATAADTMYSEINLPRYTDTSANQFLTATNWTLTSASAVYFNSYAGIYKKSAAITRIDIFMQNGTSSFDGGTAYLYGVS